VGLEVPESGDDLKTVVNGFAAASALTEDLPVFEPGDGVFDAGPDPALHPVAVVSDDVAGLVALRVGDGGDAAVATVTEHCTTLESVCDGVAGNNEDVAVTGPAAADNDHAAPVSADEDMRR
jgi:hypothetical protein